MNFMKLQMILTTLKNTNALTVVQNCFLMENVKEFLQQITAYKKGIDLMEMV